MPLCIFQNDPSHPITMRVSRLGRVKKWQTWASRSQEEGRSRGRGRALSQTGCPVGRGSRPIGLAGKPTVRRTAAAPDHRSCAFTESQATHARRVFDCSRSRDNDAHRGCPEGAQIRDHYHPDHLWSSRRGAWPIEPPSSSLGAALKSVPRKRCSPDRSRMTGRGITSWDASVKGSCKNNFAELALSFAPDLAAND